MTAPTIDRRLVELPSPKGARSTLAREIYMRLKTAILTNEYLPGQYLTELELAEVFETSKSPVRDALKQLQAERLVDAVSKRGYVITTLTSSDVKERLQVRQILEIAAAELAVYQIGESGLDQLRQMVADLGSSIPDSDEKGQLLHNRQFHSAIAELSGNVYLAELIDHVHSDLQRALFADILSSSVETMKRDHEAIIESLAGRDSGMAKAAAARHVEETRLRVLS